MKYLYKGLVLDLHHPWRFEGIERSNVVQETEEAYIKYSQLGNTVCWKNSLEQRKNKFPLNLCIRFFSGKSLSWMQRLLNIPFINQMSVLPWVCKFWNAFCLPIYIQDCNSIKGSSAICISGRLPELAAGTEDLDKSLTSLSQLQNLHQTGSWC